MIAPPHTHTHRQMWCHGSLNYGLFVCWQLRDEGTLVRMEPDCWWGDRNECHTSEEKGQVFCHVLHPRQNQATSCLTDEWAERQIKMRNSVYARWQYKSYICFFCLYSLVGSVNPALYFCKTCGVHIRYLHSQLTDIAKLNSSYKLYYTYTYYFLSKNEKSKHNIWSISTGTIKPPGTKE